MRRDVLMIVLMVCVWPLFTEAVQSEDFLVRTTKDYVEICTTNPNDPLYAAAVGFCHGYGVGAFHYYLATTEDAGEKGFVCFPEPRPARADIVQMFVAWVREHPQYLGERPVDSLFRFLASKWPCQR